MLPYPWICNAVSDWSQDVQSNFRFVSCPHTVARIRQYDRLETMKQHATLPRLLTAARYSVSNDRRVSNMVTATYRGYEMVNSKVLESYILPCRAKQSTLLDSLAALLLTDTVGVLKYRARDIRAKIRYFHMTHT